MARPDANWHWRGFLLPVHRDLIFWFALLMSALLLVPQFLLLGWRPAEAGWWFRAILQVSLTIIVMLSIVGTGAGIARGWERGLEQARARKTR
jgi:hypothetical protein